MSVEFSLPGPDMPVLDESRLLAEFAGDQEILTELRDLFMEHVPPLFREIEAAVAAGQTEEILRHAHSLKGACATYGAPRLALVCQSAEFAARDGDIQAVRDHLSDIRQEYEQVCAAISSVEAPTP